MSTKFIHLRKGWSESSFDETGGLVFVDHLLPHGGATLAFEQDGTIVRYSYALCSDRDNYDKSLGRTIAAGRLHRGNGHVRSVELTSLSDGSAEYYRNLERAVVEDFKANVQGR